MNRPTSFNLDTLKEFTIFWEEFGQQMRIRWKSADRLPISQKTKGMPSTPPYSAKDAGQSVKLLPMAG